MNILLNLSNFHEDWAQEVMSQVLHPEMRVCLLPLSFHENWIRNKKEWRIEYGPKGKCYLELIEPYLAYGIPRQNIQIVNYFTDTPESAREKVLSADVLFFTGGFPDKMMGRLYDLDLVDTLRGYEGIVMGTSAGAMIQFDTYHITEDQDYDEFQYHDGLGYLDYFEIEVHYEGTDVQHAAIERVMEERGLPVIAIGNQGGVVVDGPDIIPMGDVEFYGFDEDENWEESEGWDDDSQDWQEEEHWDGEEQWDNNGEDWNEEWNDEDGGWENQPDDSEENWQNENEY